MRKLEMFKTVSLVVLGAIFMSCSARDIVQEANPYLDPKPVTTFTTTRGEDPLAKDQWNIKTVGANATGGLSQEGSRRVKVALLGTGVDYTHEDLAPNIWINRGEWTELTPGVQNATDQVDSEKNNYVDDFIGYDFVENDGLPFDRNGAGTAMAGVLGAATGNSKGIRGVVSDISIVPVKFLDGSGSMLFPNLLKALNYALDTKVDLVLLHTPSYEFGSTMAGTIEGLQLAEMERNMLRQTLENLKNASIPIVASAGNSGNIVDGKNSLLVEMAKFTNVIIVTAVDEKDARPPVANYGRERVHTSAPGHDVLTTAVGNKYEKASGTAIAAAHVAGALALAINQTYGRIEPRKLIEGFLKPEASDKLAGNMVFETIGGNRLNIPKYLSFLGTK